VTAETVVLDTDVASHLMRGTLPAALVAHLSGKALAVTFVTVGELWRGATHAGWGNRRRSALAGWMERRTVIEGSERVAQTWGELTGDALHAGRPLPANDAWVAACCLVHASALATLNVRHYAAIDDLRLIPTAQ
jgi:predicted nucleic acid-binding protein